MTDQDNLRDRPVKEYHKRIGRVTQQCDGINTKNGKRCQRRTAADSGMCYSHEEQASVVGEWEKQ